jgi:hypothetical protein
MEKRMKFLTKLGTGRLLPYLLCLSLLVLPSLAAAWNGVFLSTNAANSAATYIVRFETTIWGEIDKISMTFPPGTDVTKAALGRIMVNDKVTEDDGKGRDDNKLKFDSTKPNFLLVDLGHSRRVSRGSIVLIELFNLSNPEPGVYSDKNGLNITIQDKWGHWKETASFPSISILAGAVGSGDITAVTPGTGLTGGGTSGDVTLGLIGSYQLPQACSNGQVPKWNGATWSCAPDEVSISAGDITAVNTPPGSGLTGGAASGDVTLGVAVGGITSAMIQDGAVGTADLADGVVTAAKLGANSVDSSKILDGSILAVDVDTSQIQRRVTGTCPANEAIRVVNADGTVTCQPTSGAGGGVTEVTASAPLVSSGGATPNIELPHVIISKCDALVSECNTAVGVGAFFSNTSGTFNSAFGSSALASNLDGANNTAIGSVALANNTSGSNNAALGVEALHFNDTGSNNVALGRSALRGNFDGQNNIAIGSSALELNGSGANNVGIGTAALNNNSGSNNTALGAQALVSNDSGSNNIAIGFNAGSAVTTGNNNILLANSGVDGESDTIRIGRIGVPASHARTFIGGIRGVTTGVANAVSVMIDSSGQLGTVSSSRRYKEEIRDMGEASNGLLRLRPVTFRYKQAAVTGGRSPEYGLIAEEVAEVYPDLVVHSATGEIETVQYHKLVPMLLNELQKQVQQLGKQEEEITQLKARLAALERLVPSKESLAQW